MAPHRSGRKHPFAVAALACRQTSWSGAASSPCESVGTSGVALLRIAGAVVFGHFLAATRIHFVTANGVGRRGTPARAILLQTIFRGAMPLRIAPGLGTLSLTAASRLVILLPQPVC